MMVSGGDERKWASGGDAWFSIDGLMVVVVMMGFGSVLKMTLCQFQLRAGRMKDGSEQEVGCQQADNSREVIQRAESVGQGNEEKG